MSDPIWIPVIVAVVFVILLALILLGPLGSKIKSLKTQMGREGLAAEVETHAPALPAEPNPNRPPDAAPSASNRLTVRNVDMIGEENQVSARGNTEVSDIRQVGKKLSLTAENEDPQKR